MHVASYLNRIGLESVSSTDLSTLTTLQQQHMRHVPFENLDVMRGVPITLDVHDYYEKVIQHHRGGFCYELNGLFHWLLKALGFQNKLISAIVRASETSWAKEDSHATQIVTLGNESYLVDVGFGDSARIPLPLSGEPREDVSGIHRIYQISEEQYDLETQSENGQWKTLFRFNTDEKALADFQAGCDFNQHSPDSHFTQKDLVTIATKDGRTTLSGDELTITSQNEKQKSIVTPDSRATILEKHFGIRL